MSAPPKKRLGEMLIEAGVIDETQLKAALGHQRRWGGKLGQSLVDMKMTTENHIVEALAKRFGYEVVDLRSLAPSPALDAALQLVPRDLATRHTFLPFAVDAGSLSVAMSDPSNIGAVDELSFRTGKRIKVALAGDREVYDAVRRFYYAEEEAEKTVEPISLELEHAPLELETTADPFGSLQSYFDEMAGAAPRPTPPAPPPSLPPSWPSQAPARAGQSPVAPPPPPVSPLAAPPPLPFEAGAPPDAFDDDVILDATDLAPVTGEEPLGPSGQEVLEAVLRLSRGEPIEEAVVSSRQLAAGLIRLLLDKELVTPAEVAAALAPR
ncbi:MAG TPA: hypothetical protein VFE30_12505 [Anaeromyxobacteraceae bacterium]|nr:hypothetical protein [Anaeromyxobacteraceae bacterium]